MTMPCLATQLPLQVYASESEFKQALTDLDRRCGRLRIERPQDIFLDPEGRLQGRFKLTRQGLNRLCGRLASGLTRLLNDLSGDDCEVLVRRAKTEPSWAMASKVYNEVVKHRFVRLQGSLLHVDYDTLQVVGWSRTRRDNKPNFSRTPQEMLSVWESSPMCKLEFVEGCLQGCWFVAKYVLPSSDPQAHGVLCSYSSVSDVRTTLTPLLWLEEGSAVCPARELRPYPLRPQQEAAYFETVLGKLAEQRRQATTWLELLRTRSLFPRGIDPRQTEREFKELCSVLQYRAIRGKVAKAILGLTLLPGGPEPGMSVEWLQEAYARRTAWDIFKATLSVASQQTRLDVRFDVEQFAYRVLRDEITFHFSTRTLT